MNRPTDSACTEALEQIVAKRHATPIHRASLVAITGIDGCGKGYISSLLAKQLEKEGLEVALINIDGWLNLPETRFSPANPAEHFYLNAIRFDDLFSDLVLPLRDHRSVRLEMDFVEETASQYHKFTYEFANIDIVLLEGIYLLKRELRQNYDLSFWVSCRFETALGRAVARAQEGLPPAETVRAYRTIYFPAQEIHLRRDHPLRAATDVIDNEAHLA